MVTACMMRDMCLAPVMNDLVLCRGLRVGFVVEFAELFLEGVDFVVLVDGLQARVGAGGGTHGAVGLVPGGVPDYG